MSLGAGAAGHLAFFIGPFFALVTAVGIGLLKDPIRTVIYLVALVVVLYLLRKRIRQFGSQGETREQASMEKKDGESEIPLQ